MPNRNGKVHSATAAHSPAPHRAARQLRHKNVQLEGWYTGTVGRFALQVTPNPDIAKFVEDKL